MGHPGINERMLPNQLSDDDLHLGTVKFFKKEKDWGAQLPRRPLPPERDAWLPPGRPSGARRHFEGFPPL